MPTYDYRCNACQHEFELFQSMSDAPKRKCPECGKLKLERLIGTGAAVIFKGSGFYETDYRSDNYKKSAKAETESGPKGDSDSKPAKGDDKKREDKKSDDKKSEGDRGGKKPDTKPEPKPAKPSSDSKPDKKG